MNKKTFLIILVLSVVVTYGVSIVEALVRNSFFAGEAGFPFRFSNATLFGNGRINYLFFALDIVFWFVILFGIWKSFLRIVKK